MTGNEGWKEHRGKTEKNIYRNKIWRQDGRESQRPYHEEEVTQQGEKYKKNSWTWTQKWRKHGINEIHDRKNILERLHNVDDGIIATVGKTALMYCYYVRGTAREDEGNLWKNNRMQLENLEGQRCESEWGRNSNNTVTQTPKRKTTHGREESITPSW